MPGKDILRCIKTLAPFVARMGPAFEALALQKNGHSPEFAFLSGGEGAAYFRWQVRALKAAYESKGLGIGQRTAPLTADDRGALLGQQSLPASTVPAPPGAPAPPGPPAQAAGPSVASIAGEGTASPRSCPPSSCGSSTCSLQLVIHPRASLRWPSLH